MIPNIPSLYSSYSEMLSVRLAFLRCRNNHVASIATKANIPMTPPTIAAVGDDCDELDVPDVSTWLDDCGVEGGFPNDELVVGVKLLRRGIDDSDPNDGLYVM